MGAAMGAGMGMGMGASMAQNMPGPWGAQPPGAAAPPPPPPPPPAGKQWHLAVENGATSGPFGEGDLRRLAAIEGRLSRATMVWTAGQDGWKMAAETELAATSGPGAAAAPPKP
jgi:hypothetical protein